MTVDSLPPSGPANGGPAPDDDILGGLEAPCGLRPSALGAALVAGGVAWCGLVGSVIWAL